MVKISVENTRQPKLSFGGSGRSAGGTSIEIADSSWRSRVSRVIYSSCFEFAMAVVLISNLLLIIVDADFRASQQGLVPWYIDLCGDVCFVIYIFEFVARLFVERAEVLQSQWNQLDLAVIVIGIVEFVLSLLTNFASSMAMIRIVRVVRTLRVVRAVKLMSALTELRKLTFMMIFCFKTLFWSFIMCFIVMTIWAVLMVELVHPVIFRIAQEDPGAFEDAGEALKSFSSVMMANLTIFRTVVAGDDWGTVVIPVILRSPATALVFVPALITLVYGVLNLIIALVVDSFAEQRDHDMDFLMQERQEEEAWEKKQLRTVFDSIDENHSGSVSYEELAQAAQDVPIFSQRLRFLHVDGADLAELFKVMDADGDGEIDVGEFVDALYNMRCADQKSTAVIMKSYIVDMKKLLNSAVSHLEQLKAGLGLACSAHPSQSEGLSTLALSLGDFVHSGCLGRGPAGLVSNGRSVAGTPSLQSVARESETHANLVSNGRSMGTASLQSLARESETYALSSIEESSELRHVISDSFRFSAEEALIPKVVPVLPLLVSAEEHERRSARSAGSSARSRAKGLQHSPSDTPRTVTPPVSPEVTQMKYDVSVENRPASLASRLP